MAQICGDLVVVELGEGSVASSEAGMFLADNGARVIKIEPPEGDHIRRTMPSGWLVWNRGKESVAVDLRTSDGYKTARELIAAADVVIEGLPAGVAQTIGLDYDQVSVEHPGLIFCSIKGFGEEGKHSCIRDYDALVMAKAGAFARGDFGFRQGPIFTGARIPSNGAAHQALSGIMAALIVRDRTGRGQKIDTSLYLGLSPMDYFMHYHVQLSERNLSAANSANPPAGQRRIPVATRYMVSGCTRDGRWIFFSPQLPHQAKALMKALDLDGMLEDQRYESMPAFFALEDAEEWENRIAMQVKERDLGELVERCLEFDELPFESVLSAEQALDHTQVRANGNVVTVVDDEFGAIEQVGPIALFGLTPAAITRSAPRLGDHNPLPRPQKTPPGQRSLPLLPLEGVTIVEFGYFYAMPYGVTMAAALGARVIKIENLEGDPMRWGFGPPEWGSMKTMEGKESISLNVRTEQGRTIMEDLLRRADVFVQGFRPGVDHRLGVDFESVCKLNPEIVYVHAAGYGVSGPYAHRPIFAGTVAAAAGSVHRQGAYWLDPELNAPLDALSARAVVGPRMRNQTDGDANAAVAVLSAILLALRHRLRTGEGQFVGTSMIGGNVLAYSDDFNRYRGKVAARQADPEQYGLSATHRLYAAQVGWVCLVTPTQDEWETAMSAAGRHDILADSRFDSPEARDANDEALTAVLTEAFRARTATEWEHLMLNAGANCVSVTETTLEQTMVADPVLRDMGLVAEIHHPHFGKLLRYAPPVALSLTPGRVERASLFSEHTEALLNELGYTEVDVAKLAADGVIRLPDRSRSS